jgi:hypothetical protein
MEVFVTLTPDQYKISQASNFIIKFYWFEKNRTFEIPKLNFTHSPTSEYQYYFKLPSIIEGNYRFHATGSITNYNLKLIYNEEIIYESKNTTTHKNVRDHTFQIIETITINNDKKYSTQIIPQTQFIKDEQIHRNKIISRSIKRWNYYWYNLHYFSLNYYPENPTRQDMEQIRQLISVMSTTGIPCPRCKGHFNQYIRAHPIETEALPSRCKLFEYFVNLHNDVNKRNHKSTFTNAQAMEKYSKCKEFENTLTSICKPLYVCFNEGKSSLFPDILQKADIA